MAATMTSRERMLAAIECRETDYIPCCFMIFAALSGRCADDEEFVRRQVEMGLDAFVPTASWAVTRNPEHRDLPGIDLRFPPQVEVRQWREQRTDGPDILHKEYITPDGTLKTEVEATDDWPLPDYVPLFDDYLVPRARKFPVESIEDLAALRHLLPAPHPEDVAVFRARADRARDLADELGLLLRAGLGVGMDASAWLCGMEQVMIHAFDQPEFVDGLAGVLHEWNMLRMKDILAVRPDLFIRRGWYEGTDFWSPPMYKRFVLPYLKREVDLAHEMGAKFGYIHTTGTMGVLDFIMEAGVDVIIGVDPIEGMGTDMALMRERTRGRMALWGGVNGFVTVEMGADEEIRDAVAEAVDTLGPPGFILSPVDNVRDPSDDTMRRVDVFVDAWRRMR
jgi:hypothetical protein